MYRPAPHPARRLMAALALLTALVSPALADNTYRAEIVILERLADPILEEQMADRRPDMKEAEQRLWVVTEAGNVISDIRTTSNLTLNTAASRLENSGKYRVLMKTGWIQDFPPNHDGPPLRVEVGDFLEQAGHRAVEGTIEINRRRYLLVDVALNHWRASEDQSRSLQAGNRDPQGDTGASDDQADTGADPGTAAPAGDGMSPASDPVAQTDKELVTWIRETRRMRSEEIHFLDSPTIGVLVYFRPMD